MNRRCCLLWSCVKILQVLKQVEYRICMRNILYEFSRQGCSFVIYRFLTLHLLCNFEFEMHLKRKNLFAGNEHLVSEFRIWYGQQMVEIFTELNILKITLYICSYSRSSTLVCIVFSCSSCRDCHSERNWSPK